MRPKASIIRYVFIADGRSYYRIAIEDDVTCVWLKTYGGFRVAQHQARTTKLQVRYDRFIKLGEPLSAIRNAVVFSELARAGTPARHWPRINDQNCVFCPGEIGRTDKSVVACTNDNRIIISHQRILPELC